MRSAIAYSTGQKDHFDVCRSYEVFAPAGERDHHSAHSGWEIIVSPGGRNRANASMKIRGRTHSVAPGQVLLFNAQEEHVEIYSPSEVGQVRAVVFPESILADVFGETGIRPMENLFDGVEYKVGTDLISSINSIFALRQRASTSRLAFECHAVSLLLELVNRCPSNLSTRLKRLSATGNFPSNVARAQKVIANNLACAEFSLDDLAAQAGISKFHLIRSFRARLGISPMRYIQLVRLELVKSFLAQGHSVALASELAGFGDTSTANKAFKRHFGRSPRAFKPRA